MTFVDFLAYCVLLGFGMAVALREVIRWCDPYNAVEDELEDMERK